MSSFIGKIFTKQRNVGVALGAGGARGIAHLGAIRAIERSKYNIKYLAGSSMGALIAAMFAFEPDIEKVIEKFVQYVEQNEKKLEKLSIFKNLEKRELSKFQTAREVIFKFFLCSLLTRKRNIIDGELLMEFISDLLPDANIENAKIPLAVVTFDLNSMEQFVISKGSLIKAVAASSAIPGVFPPILWDGRELVDGGGISPVPVDVVHNLGANKVIAVDVSPSVRKDKENLSGLEIILRTQSGESEKLKNAELERAWKSVVVRLDRINWWNFEYYKSVMKRGFETTNLALLEK